MTLGKRTTNDNRRISLRRPGSRGERNSRRERNVAREKRDIHVPWHSIGKLISTLGVLLLIVVLLGSISLGLIYSYRYITGNEYFLLKTVAIKGNSKISSREILEIGNLDDTVNILALSIDGLEETLAANPWVQTVSVTRVLPGTIQISLVEKEAAFWLLHNGTLHYADEKGKLIAPLEAGQVAPLPTLEVEDGAEELVDALPDLVKSLRLSEIPLDMSKISLVRLSAAKGVDIYVEGSTLKISVGLDEWLLNLQRLGRVIADLSRRNELSKARSIKAMGSNVWVETAQDLSGSQ